MTITIRYSGQARQFAPSATVDIEVDEAASVNEFLPRLLIDADERLRALLVDADGRLKRSVLAVLHGEAIDPNETKLLRDGDELTFHPALAGG